MRIPATESEPENISIRLETPKDFRETEAMVREAFWDVYKPGCDEHLIIHNLRKSSSFIPGLDFVACHGDRVVGAVVCPKARIIGEGNQEFTVLSLIVGVLPSYQKKGVGSILMKRAIDEARSLGFKGIVIFGSPEYYRRFGFTNAKQYGIQTSEGENFDAFMALPLSEHSLDGIRGRFHEDDAYHPGQRELETLEKGFPYREKHVTDTQLKR
jgi:predicted N-acetyltransferase YhbS